MQPYANARQSPSIISYYSSSPSDDYMSDDDDYDDYDGCLFTATPPQLQLRVNRTIAITIEVSPRSSTDMERIETSCYSSNPLPPISPASILPRPLPNHRRHKAHSVANPPAPTSGSAVELDNHPPQYGDAHSRCRDGSSASAGPYDECDLSSASTVPYHPSASSTSSSSASLTEERQAGHKRKRANGAPRV